MKIEVLLNGKKATDTESKKKVIYYWRSVDRNYRSYKSIFSERTQKQMDVALSNNSIIDFRENYQNGPILSDVSYFKDGVNTKTGKCIFRLSLGTKVADNVVKHELWHLCMRPQKEDRIQYKQAKVVTFHGCQRITEASKEKIDKGEAKAGDVIGYGSGLEEGMANITAILATIKEKAAIYKNGKIMGYKKDILALADKYINTGEIDPRLGIIRGNYQVYEDIARLLIMISRNDYMLEHPFSEALESDEGIDGWIEHPVNKPYSSFIYSSVNADADFEREWNSFNEKCKKKELGSISYLELNGALDLMKEKIINGGTKALNEKEMQDISAIINRIERFYDNKLDILVSKRIIDSDKREKLKNRYKVSANSIINNMLRAKKSDGR